MWFHPFDECADSGLQLFSLASLRTSAAGHNRPAAQSLGQSHFIHQAERPQLVLSDAAQCHAGILQHLGEAVFAQVIKLLSLIPMAFRPDVDGGCPGVQNVRDGVIGATSMQFPLRMAVQGVEAAASGVLPVPDEGLEFTNTGVVLITDQPFDGIESQDTTWGLDNCWG